MTDVETTRKASADGTMACAAIVAYPVTDAEGLAAAPDMLAEFNPDIMVSTERIGRN